MLEVAKSNDVNAKQLAEQVYADSRDTIQLAEKLHQETEFNKKILLNNINELNNKIKVNSEEKGAYLLRQTEAEDTLKLTPMETLKTNLSVAIDNKQLRETALAEARNALAEAETQMQELERVRMQN